MQSICKSQDHSTVQLDLALGYTEMIWERAHAPRRWWHFQITIAVTGITFPSFHLGRFAGFISKIKNIMIILICLPAHKHLFFSLQHYQHSKHHTCLYALIYFNPDTSMPSRLRKKKTLKPVPNVRQLAINPHGINWTNYSPPVINTQPIQLTQSLCIAVVFCTAILMCHRRAAFCRSARLPGKLS